MVKRLNANQLKLIAIVAMTVDHVADLLYPSFPAQPVAVFMHIIGRLTAPIMWFFISEGFHYTHDAKKYITRLGVFALISHFAYCFGFGLDPIPFRTPGFNQTSVMYPLFIGAVVLWLDHTELKIDKRLKWLITFVLIWSAFPCDWSCIAVLVIVAMYNNRGDLKKQMLYMMLWVTVYAVVCFFFINKVFALVQFFVILVYPLLKQYNGEKGKATWMKWFFYLYYPAHLIIIGIIRAAIYGNASILF